MSASLMPYFSRSAGMMVAAMVGICDSMPMCMPAADSSHG